MKHNVRWMAIEGLDGVNMLTPKHKSRRGLSKTLYHCIYITLLYVLSVVWVMYKVGLGTYEDRQL